MAWQDTRPDRRRGAALVAVAIFLGALLAATTVGVDVGRLALTAGEVQNVADAAATAGALTLLGNVHDGGADDPREDAIAIGTRNMVDGGVPTLETGDVLVGRYDFETRAFLDGGVPPNAVAATSRATVQNIVGAVIGSPTSTVERTAMAVMGGVASGRPTLPIVVGECKFQQFQGSGICSDLPSLSLAPDPTDNSGWTSLAADSANAARSMRYLPGDCGGGGQAPPAVHVGQFVNVMNGNATTVLQTVKDCHARGHREFMIPIVRCGSSSNYNQAMEVVGFATIRIDSVVDSGPRKGVNLESICETQQGGGVGPSTFGTETIALIR